MSMTSNYEKRLAQLMRDPVYKATANEVAKKGRRKRSISTDSPKGKKT